MSAQHARLRVFSGVQPTGKLHLGNYVGALDVWVGGQDQHDNVFCIVDLHALTIPEAVRPDDLRSKVREVAGLYVACGIDPAASAIFVQSRVSAHAELAWILNCVTPLGWLERMTQYKAKSAGTERVGTGLLDYPVLQAADILLYDTNRVPVGEDQRQHMELARDIARRFNHLFGETFVIPDAMIRPSGARLMGLDDPTIKMSKSIGAQRAGHAIGLLDPPDVIQRTIMGAVTDPHRETRFDHAGLGVLNLLVIYEALSGEARPAIEARFEGQGYGYLKRTLAEVVVERLTPIQRRYAEIVSNLGEIDHILEEGAERVRPRAEATMDRVRRLTGLAERPSA
ncbi:MAG: tryptophan--tRNA ligase [Gemmatimonadetes bacterium]|nr:tryptophan--tRNA ligase [Gemmatimonadota bacterium]